MQTSGFRPELARSLDRSLVVILCAGVMLVGLQAVLLPLGGPFGPILALFPIDVLVYLGAGLIAWYRRPSNGMGAVILLGGWAIWLGGLGNSDPPVLVAAGAIGATLILAVVVHLLHAFPSGRLRGRVSIATVAVAYANSLLAQAPRYLFDPEGPSPVLFVADRPGLLVAGVWLQQVVGAGIMLSTATVLVHRLRRADPSQRRVLIPLFGFGVLVVLFVPIASTVLGPVLGMPAEVRVTLQLLLIGGIPIAFALGVLRGGFARTAALEELSIWLGGSPGTRPALAQALARAVGDPSLTLSFWVPRQGTFVDHDGIPVQPARDPDRGFVEVELDGRRVGAIGYDATLIADPEPVRRAGQVVAIAVERERLTAELRESHGALQRSRERLVDAADRERRRIGQDLHDGLQMQLVLLALEAQQLAKDPMVAPAIARRATLLRQGLDDAAADVRRVVMAVMPAALVERGLGAAVEDLVDRMPVPSELELDMGRTSWSPAVESTAYFVTAEALTNAVKHARASSVRVRLTSDEQWLSIDVHDDGVGGAHAGEGSGLRGLADRVDVLGGRLDIASEPGRGTRIGVRLPCG